MIRFLDFLDGVPSMNKPAPSPSLAESLSVTPFSKADTAAIPATRIGRKPQTMADAFEREKKDPVPSPAPVTPSRRRTTTFRDVFTKASVQI